MGIMAVPKVLARLWGLGDLDRVGSPVGRNDHGHMFGRLADRRSYRHSFGVGHRCDVNGEPL
jgi:hypothetical protein